MMATEAPRPILGTKQPQLTARQLKGIASAMSAAGSQFDGPLAAVPMTGGRSNLTFTLSDGSDRWVLRMPPRVGVTPSAHDVGREHRITSALAGTQVPVAETVLFCENPSVLGGPFTVSRYVEGAVVRTQAELAAYDDDSLRSITDGLLDTLAALHHVDPTDVGLEDLGPRNGYAERQLRRWRQQWEHVGPSELTPLVHEVAAALGSKVPMQGATAIVHGDYRIDNTLLAADLSVAAVVDWELSTLGDPVADVALMCAYRCPAFDLILGEPSAWTSARLPDVDTLAAGYEHAAGVLLTDWPGHLGLACFKVAVLAAGIDHRRRVGGASGPGFDTAGEAVEPYLELARTALEVGR